MSDIRTPLVFDQEPDVRETFNVLLYGKPKMGKTTAAATAPGPIMWVNAEGPGALGYARKVAASRGTNIYEKRIGNRALTPDPAGVLEQVYRHVLSGEAPIVRTVVVDTVAKVRDALINQFVVKNSKDSRQQYGMVNDKLGGFINALRDLDVNLVLLAHVDEKNVQETGSVDPLIGGALTAVVPGEVDVVSFVMRLPAEGDTPARHVGQLVEARGRSCGDRSDGLAADGPIRDLDLTVWLEVYRAALTPDSDTSNGTSESAAPAVVDDDPARDPDVESQLDLAANA